MPRPTRRRPSTPQGSTNGTRTKAPATAPKYRTVAQIPHELGIGPAILKKLVRDQPWVRVIGLRTFVEVAEFQAWFDAQQPQPRK
jgi:hypothetical protein